MEFIRETAAVTLILFSVIDVVGSLPVIVDLKSRTGPLRTGQATCTVGLIMFGFLFVGEAMLSLLGTDVASFAVAGALVMFAVGVEMLLGINLFREESTESPATSVVPLAFPLLAGAGTLTTLLTLKAEFSRISILSGIVFNLAIVYGVLRASDWIENRLGTSGLQVLRKVFGIVLLSIAVKIIRSNLG